MLRATGMLASPDLQFDGSPSRQEEDAVHKVNLAEKLALFTAAPEWI